MSRPDEHAAFAKAKMFLRPSMASLALIDRLMGDQETEADGFAAIVLTLILSEGEAATIKRAVDNEACSAVAREMLGSPAEIAERIRVEVSSALTEEMRARALMSAQEAGSFRSAIATMSETWAEVTWFAIGGES